MSVPIVVAVVPSSPGSSRGLRAHVRRIVSIMCLALTIAVISPLRTISLIVVFSISFSPMAPARNNAKVAVDYSKLVIVGFPMRGSI
jgi:hypothetical protein